MYVLSGLGYAGLGAIAGATPAEKYVNWYKSLSKEVVGILISQFGIESYLGKDATTIVRVLEKILGGIKSIIQRYPRGSGGPKVPAEVAAHHKLPQMWPTVWDALNTLISEIEAIGVTVTAPPPSAKPPVTIRRERERRRTPPSEAPPPPEAPVPEKTFTDTLKENALWIALGAGALVLVLASKRGK